MVPCKSHFIHINFVHIVLYMELVLLIEIVFMTTSLTLFSLTEIVVMTTSLTYIMFDLICIT